MAHPLTTADLPPDLARFAEAEMASGRFASVEDALRACMTALAAKQHRAAVAAGDASPDFEGNAFSSVRAELGLPVRKESAA